MEKEFNLETSTSKNEKNKSMFSKVIDFIFDFIHNKGLSKNIHKSLLFGKKMTLEEKKFIMR